MKWWGGLLRPHRVIPALVFLAGACWQWHMERRLTGVSGFPLDDPWIHLQFARNIAEGHGFSFNVGEPVAGSTAPLWTILLALPIRLGLDAVVSAKLLGMLFGLIAVWAASVLAERLSGSRLAAMVAGAACALSPRFTAGSISGMEIPLYVALFLLAVAMYVGEDGRGWRWGLLFGLSGAARPELFAACPLLILYSVMTRRDARFMQATIAYGVVAGLYIGLNLYTSGRPLPSTFYAKTAGGNVFDVLAGGHAGFVARALATQAWEHLNTSWRWYVEQSAILFLGLLTGALALLESPAGAAVLWLLVGLPALVGVVSPGPPLLLQYGRYVVHLLALFFVVSACGLVWLKARVRRGWIVSAVALLALARLAAQDVKFANQHARMVQNITVMQVAMGRWIATNTPDNALIATNDIGAIGWYSRRRILDTEGLITPAIVPFKRAGRMFEFLEAQRPDLLVVFPEWYPSLIARTNDFTEVFRIEVPEAVSSANRALVVYRTPWQRRP